MFTEDQARVHLDEVLTRLRVSAGDRVMLGIDMGGVPLPAYPAAFTRQGLREREQRWCRFVFTALMERLGHSGTLLVPSFSYSCGRAGAEFIAETTTSEVGPFTEFVRSQPEAFRSLHPIFSLTGVGRDAPALLGDVGRAAFGARSPFGRFAALGVRFLCLGVEIRNSLTYVHHLEHMYGCPHRFHKSFDTAVIAGGQRQPGDWYAYVAYRGLDYTSDIASLQDGLKSAGGLAEAEWNGRPNHLAEVAAVDAVGYRLLEAEPCAFVDRRLTFRFEEGTPARADGPGMSTLVIRGTVR